MLTKIETNHGTFFLEEKYDTETNETYYDVYDEPLEDEIYGDFLWEFKPSIIYHKDMSPEDLEIFIKELVS